MLSDRFGSEATSWTYSEALTHLQGLLARPQTNRDSLFRAVCSVSADLLYIERVGIWLLCDGGQTLRCAMLYERSPRAFSAEGLFHTAEFPNYFASLANRRGIHAITATADPRMNEFAEPYLIPLGISSMMDVPLVQGDEVIGVICHEAVGPARPWSAADCAYAETVARMLSQALAQLSPSGHAKAIVESAERLSRTAAGVAHDFLNLLTIVQGNTELIRLSLPPDLDPNLSQRLQTILEVVDRGTELAKDLGICARRQLAVPRVLSISKKVQEFLPVLHLLLKGQHSLQFENHSRGGLVFMDPVSIERIVLNLVKNAQEASAPGTTIIVRIDDDIAVDPEEPLRRFKRLTVQDQGRGIPADQLSSIFTPYTTSKFASATSGLGLTVVQELTERFGGFVRVESEVGVGSRFLVFIPRISAGRPYVHPICAEPALG